MYVRLTRKLAEMIDGIDLRQCEVGDVIELPEREGILLIAEGWAIHAHERRTTTAEQPVEQAADAPDRWRIRPPPPTEEP